MKIRLRNTYAGPDGTFVAGSVVKFDKKEAKMLIKQGYAEEVTDTKVRSPEDVHNRKTAPKSEDADVPKEAASESEDADVPEEAESKSTVKKAGRR